MTVATQWQRLVDFVVAREEPTGLALTRILACGTIAVHLAVTLASGAARFTWTHLDDGGLSASSLSKSLGPTGVLAAVGAIALCALTATVGFFTRVSLLLTFIGFRILSDVTASARGSYDQLLINLLFILLVSGCGAALAWDARRPRPEAARGTMRFGRLLCVLQLVLLYFGGGLYKLSLSWVPGGDASALWFALQQPLWARFPAALPSSLFGFTQVATTSVWLFEISAPIFLLAFVLDESGSQGRVARALRRVHFRALYLGFGVLMHVGIEVLMEVGPFSFASLALYPSAIAPATWTRLRALRTRSVRALE